MFVVISYYSTTKLLLESCRLSCPVGRKKEFRRLRVVLAILGVVDSPHYLFGQGCGPCFIVVSYSFTMLPLPDPYIFATQWRCYYTCEMAEQLTTSEPVHSCVPLSPSFSQLANRRATPSQSARAHATPLRVRVRGIDSMVVFSSTEWCTYK